MARFATHTEGGSWTGGGTEVPNCSVARQRQINVSLANIRTKISKWSFPCLESLRHLLNDRLNCSLIIDCDSSDCSPQRDGFSPDRGSASIILCANAFNSTQQRLNAIVFHEMIHSAGGTELDAEALENHFYQKQGATFPTSDDFPKFKSDGGEFIIWDRATGNLFERCVEGGSWVSPGTVTQGKQLTPNFPDPGDGGGGSWI